MGPEELARGQVTVIPGRVTDYEYKINPMDKCMILARPVGSKMGYAVYGTFTTPAHARRILATLTGRVAEDERE